MAGTKLYTFRGLPPVDTSGSLPGPLFIGVFDISGSLEPLVVTASSFNASCSFSVSSLLRASGLHLFNGSSVSPS